MSNSELLRAHPLVEAGDLVRLAAATLKVGANGLALAFDESSTPIYATDRDGWVIYFNPACIDFAGRTPRTGEDRWCVSCRLFTESGIPIPHEACPMADTIRQKKSIRGAIAVAERPDGSRVTFQPHPAPVLDEEGELIGAVNVLLDVTERRRADSFKAEAQRCRRLAQSITDRRTVDTLTLMAKDYEAKARDLVP